MEVPADLKLRPAVRGSHGIHRIVGVVTLGHVGGGGAFAATGEIGG